MLRVLWCPSGIDWGCLVISGFGHHLGLTDTLRVCFFKKIQDWILKSERILKWVLCFFTRQINPRYFGSWRVKGTEEFSLEVDSSVPLTHRDPKDLGLICLVKKRKIYFRILSDFRIQSWIFLKKRTLSWPWSCAAIAGIDWMPDKMRFIVNFKSRRLWPCL